MCLNSRNATTICAKLVGMLLPYVPKWNPRLTSAKAQRSCPGPAAYNFLSTILNFTLYLFSVSSYITSGRFFCNFHRVFAQICSSDHMKAFSQALPSSQLLCWFWLLTAVSVLSVALAPAGEKASAFLICHPAVLCGWQTCCRARITGFVCTQQNCTLYFNIVHWTAHF